MTKLPCFRTHPVLLRALAAATLAAAAALPADAMAPAHSHPVLRPSPRSQPGPSHGGHLVTTPRTHTAAEADRSARRSSRKASALENVDAPRGRKHGKTAAAPDTRTSAADRHVSRSAKVHRGKRHEDEVQDQADAPTVSRVKGRRESRRLKALRVSSSRTMRKRDLEEASVPTPPLKARRSVASEAARPGVHRNLSSEDFMKAAGASPADLAARIAPPVQPEEKLLTGESHPDDDERLPVHAGDTATRKPEPVPVSSRRDTAPKPTLGTEVHTLAAKAETAVKKDVVAAKTALTKKPETNAPGLMPEDHDAKAAMVAQAVQPVILRTRNGRLMMPAPMKGSHDILVHQNTMADSEGLTRIQDDDDLDRLRAQHQLVLLPASASLEVNGELPYNRRYARPWAARFAEDMGQAFYARFHQPLRLNSAVRTVAYQLRLQRVNGNAAAVDGDGASPHLTGQALDFGKRGMSAAQLAWMRSYLLPLMQAGKIDVEEEFHQACFHVSVYHSYMQGLPRRGGAPRMELAREQSAPALPATPQTSGALPAAAAATVVKDVAPMP